MELSFETLEKKWDEGVADIYKKLSTTFIYQIPKDILYGLEYITIKKIATKKLKPKLIVINGPGGAGKSTIGKELERLGFNRIPRLTDRKKRPAEINGKDYQFVTTEAFDALYSAGDILAAKNTYGFRRGFLKNSFEQIAYLNSKAQFYTEGDSSLKAFQEAQKIFNLSFDDVLNIFILPPSFKELYKRLSDGYNKGNFTKEEFNIRLEEGIKYLIKSIAHFEDFPNSVFLVNDDIDRLCSVFSIFAIKNNFQKTDCLLPILDDEGNLQGISTRFHAHRAGLLHPISVVYVFDSQGRLILQKRSDSGLWDNSSAGHLDLGETYQEAAQREMTEELGVQEVPLFFIGSGILAHPLIPTKKRHYFHLFSCIFDGPLKLQNCEVLEVCYISIKELEHRLTYEPMMFSGGFHATYEYYKSQLLKT